MRLFGARGKERLKMQRVKMGAVMHVSRNGLRLIDCRDDEGDAFLGVVSLSGLLACLWLLAVRGTTTSR